MSHLATKLSAKIYGKVRLTGSCTVDDLSSLVEDLRGKGRAKVEEDMRTITWTVEVDFEGERTGVDSLDWFSFGRQVEVEHQEVELFFQSRGLDHNDYEMSVTL